MSERPVFTYQTRPVLGDEQAAVLHAYAELYGRTERSLFAALQAGGKLNDLKRDFLPGLASPRASSTRCVSDSMARWIRSSNAGLT